MNSFWTNHGTKILGWFTTTLGTIGTLLLTGAFNGLLQDTSIRWLTIIVAVLTGGTGVATVQRGNVNTAQIKVADAITTALNTPPPKQSGFARPLMLAIVLAIAVPVVVALPGCATKSPQTQLILETTTRMAVRRALADSDRAVEKARNIRAVAERLQGIVTAESTILGLRDEVMSEIAKLDLSPLDRADAVDLVNLFAAILQENYGDEIAGDERMVKVRQFLDILLSTLPV